MTISQSIILYLGLVVSPLVIFKKNNIVKNRRLKIIVFILIILLPMALRADVGADYYNYIKMYKEISGMGLVVSLKRNWAEPLYILMNLIVYYIFDDYNFIFILTSFIFIVGMVSEISRYQKKFFFNIGIALFIFMSRFYFPMFTTIRLSLALVTVFYNYKNILEKNIGRYLLVAFLATGFHYTAIITLPLYWLINMPTSHKNIIIPLVFMGFVFTLLFFDEMSVFLLKETKYYKYSIDHRMYNFSGGINQLIAHFPLVFLVSFYKNRLLNSNSDNELFIKIFMSGSILMFFTLWIGILDRMIQYFLVVQIILIPQVYIVAPKEEKNLVFFFIITYYFLRLFLQFNGNIFLPYRSILGF